MIHCLRQEVIPTVVVMKRRHLQKGLNLVEYV